MALFVSSCIMGGLLIEYYSITRPYISETFAVDTEYGMLLRIFGHIPSGILYATFGLLPIQILPADGTNQNRVLWNWRVLWHWNHCRFRFLQRIDCRKAEVKTTW